MSRNAFVLFLFNRTSEPWNHSSFCGLCWFFFWPACIWTCTHESILNVSDVKRKKRKKSEVGGFVDTVIGKFYSTLYLFGHAFSTLTLCVLQTFVNNDFHREGTWWMPILDWRYHKLFVYKGNSLVIFFAITGSRLID